MLCFLFITQVIPGREDELPLHYLRSGGIAFKEVGFSLSHLRSTHWRNAQRRNTQQRNAQQRWAPDEP